MPTDEGTRMTPRPDTTCPELRHVDVCTLGAVRLSNALHSDIFLIFALMPRDMRQRPCRRGIAVAVSGRV